MNTVRRITYENLVGGDLEPSTPVLISWGSWCCGHLIRPSREKIRSTARLQFFSWILISARAEPDPFDIEYLSVGWTSAYKQTFGGKTLRDGHGPPTNLLWCKNVTWLKRAPNQPPLVGAKMLPGAHGAPTNLLDVWKTPREWKHFIREGLADKAMHNQDVPIDALRQSDCVAVLDWCLETELQFLFPCSGLSSLQGRARLKMKGKILHLTDSFSATFIV